MIVHLVSVNPDVEPSLHAWCSLAVSSFEVYILYISPGLFNKHVVRVHSRVMLLFSSSVAHSRLLRPGDMGSLGLESSFYLICDSLVDVGVHQTA